MGFKPLFPGFKPLFPGLKPRAIDTENLRFSLKDLCRFYIRIMHHSSRITKIIPVSAAG
jgi:hypothetical protein